MAREAGALVHHGRLQYCTSHTPRCTTMRIQLYALHAMRPACCVPQSHARVNSTHCQHHTLHPRPYSMHHHTCCRENLTSAPSSTLNSSNCRATSSSTPSPTYASPSWWCHFSNQAYVPNTPTPSTTLHVVTCPAPLAGPFLAIHTLAVRASPSVPFMLFGICGMASRLRTDFGMPHWGTAPGKGVALRGPCTGRDAIRGAVRGAVRGGCYRSASCPHISALNFYNIISSDGFHSLLPFVALPVCVRSLCLQSVSAHDSSHVKPGCLRVMHCKADADTDCRFVWHRLPSLLERTMPYSVLRRHPPQIWRMGPCAGCWMGPVTSQ